MSRHSGEFTPVTHAPGAQSFREILRFESVAFNLELKVACVEFEPQQCRVDTHLRAVLKAGHKLP